MSPDAFIEKWRGAPPLSERALYQTFVADLCALLDVPAPHQDRIDPDYTFERRVTFRHIDGQTAPGFIDCYKKGCFVLEAKQSGKRLPSGVIEPQLELALAEGTAVPVRSAPPAAPSAFDSVMRAARRQAEDYAKALDEWPPFLIVVDVPRAIDLWADFSRQGKNYTAFPNRNAFRIRLEDLADPAVRARLKAVWEAPLSLDPSARSAAVTRDIAALLAAFTRAQERRWAAANADADRVQSAAWAGKVALFLMRCIFAMFAEDVGLIPNKAFSRLIELYRPNPGRFHLAAAEFFRTLDTGGHNTAVQQDLARFNGGLFRDADGVSVTAEELDILSKAAAKDWSDVEPAIFGTLLEQALDPKERSELGAHYTPRAYVERLVVPTVIEPLRADWEAVEAHAIGLKLAGKAEEAQAAVRAFHRSLCEVRVLDPACGTGNFLYVALRLMKELEGEVLNVLSELGDTQYGLRFDEHTVSPAQFLGIEKNARAVPVAELVVWIGYLQWHFRTHGQVLPAEPILKDFETIRRGDALLVWDREELLTDEHGRPVTRQDPNATKLHPITGEAVPDPDARLPQFRYINPRPAVWPEADFIVGNPPFIGGKDLRSEFGDGYTEALWASRRNRFKSADLVMYWWDHAADLLTRRGTRLRRFGFITTNSLTQKFSRRVLEAHLRPAAKSPPHAAHGEVARSAGGAARLASGNPVRLVFAVPDHPWVKDVGRAAVRIAMTIAERGAPDGSGRLAEVADEGELNTDTPRVVLRTRTGVITPDLTLGADVTSAVPLRANASLCSRGVQLMGAGFIVTRAQARTLLSTQHSALSTQHSALSTHSTPIREYRNGRDLADRPRDVLVIDLFGLSEAEARKQHPAVYQHVLERVKPEREHNNRASYRDSWWVFGEPRRELRPALDGLPRYIATVETAKHRWFTFLDASIMPDNKLIVVADQDALTLGILSSVQHWIWYVSTSAKIGVYEGDAVYVKGHAFDPFPFPDATAPQKQTIRDLAEELDALRKRVIAARDFLTMTRLYNVRQALVEGRPLTDAERIIHDEGCVGVIHELHGRIDAAVAEAYGWPADLSDQEVLARLVALNRERAAEEAQGLVRWLRPDYQRGRVAVAAPAPRQTEADLQAPEVLAPELPRDPAPLARALLDALRAEGRPLQPAALAARWREPPDARARKRALERIDRTLQTLSVSGAVRRDDRGWYAPRRAA